MNYDSRINLAIQELDKALRVNKITVRNKALFVAGILIALQEKDFANNYNNQDSYDRLFSLILRSINKVMDNYPIHKTTKTKMVSEFKTSVNEKISTTPLVEQYSLFWFVDTIYTELYPLTSESSDITGMFYCQFLKYSAGDSTPLGIVLTPNHIAEFMAKAIQITPNDVVLDACCGTGSFLQAANKITNKNGLLYGIELDSDIYLLAVANAIINKGQNIHISNDDCFKVDMKSRKITKALLNPPFSQADHCELEFAYQVLEQMEPNGELAIICPLSCAIGNNYKDIRETLIGNHTLKAVFTLPEKIFRSKGASTYTCIMIWQAHIPHDSDIPTFFGNFKKDGFKFRRKWGRIDTNQNWPEIEKLWLTTYLNKKETKNLSLLHTVKANDEWLYEAYMKIDYSTLTAEDFQQTINDYYSYLVKEGIKHDH